jgi:hypothetical protein
VLVGMCSYWGLYVNVCLRACTCMFIDAFTCMYVLMHACIGACTRVYVLVLVGVCMYWGL